LIGPYTEEESPRRKKLWCRGSGKCRLSGKESLARGTGSLMEEQLLLSQGNTAFCRV